MMADPDWDWIPCGHNFFGKHFRMGCVLKCCVVPEVPEVPESRWDTDDTWSQTDVSEPSSPRQLEYLEGSGSE